MPFSKIALASNNAGKAIEIQKIAAVRNWQIISQAQFSTPEIEETGLSFIENAILKARNAAKHSGLPALADDSGLEVLALKGAPGIYSARFALQGSHKGADSPIKPSDALNNKKLLDELASVATHQRQANFRCCLALVRYEKDPCPIIGEGVWHGSIAFDALGENGFGYDPLFIVDGLNKRSAELKPKQKNQISHRALAFQNLFGKIDELNLHE
jgi:XTP/dITP diphosphohydrolase